MAYTIIPRHGLLSEFSSLNRIYAEGELLLEEQLDGTYRIKVGDGIQNYNDLLYVAGGTGGVPSEEEEFGTIAVSGQSDIVADTAAATLSIGASNGISITTNPATDTITFSNIFGTTAGTVCQGNDFRLGSAAPTAHAATHSSGGSDKITSLDLRTVGSLTLDSDVLREGDSSSGGFFSDYECRAANKVIVRGTESQTTGVGGMRDGIFVEHQDSDSTNYQTAGVQKVNNAIRVVSHGPASGGGFASTYKDIVGIDTHAIGNVQWSNRGCSGIVTGSIQFGVGIASNEFAVQNPSAASGSVAQSTSMAAVQAIVASDYADADDFPGGGHGARGVLVTNNGRKITSGVEVSSNTGYGFSGQISTGLNLGPALIVNSAITMGTSVGAGNPGTRIQYDTGDYTIFDRANNRFEWYIGDVRRAYIDTAGFHNG